MGGGLNEEKNAEKSVVYQLCHRWEFETHFGSKIQKTPDQNLGFMAVVLVLVGVYSTPFVFLTDTFTGNFRWF